MPPTGSLRELGERYRLTRQRSLALASPLGAEDQSIQSMPDASPTKWHLAHTTWFFETFILSEQVPGYAWFDEAFQVLFNSYYNGIGEQHPRPRRGLLSRPDLGRVHQYRHHVDEAMGALLEQVAGQQIQEVAKLLELGIHHEQQHQELLLTDIKHALFQNPLLPAYSPCDRVQRQAVTRSWITHQGGNVAIGHPGDGFCFDNELPRHETFLHPFELASTPVSNQEWMEFIADDGYQQPLLWLSEGWAWRQQENITHPHYWLPPCNDKREAWLQYGLGGVATPQLHDPVCHISYYEADAFARWKGCRLPTEAEWEVAQPGQADESMQDYDPAREFDRTWEWTASAYLPYPGYRAAEGAVGEYNGKFMINQMVLRGMSSATPPGHSRGSYRNFFPPSARWQYTGLRLARDLPDG